ncbi:hypothetical protein [Parvularcula dongshanensis]|uniref:Mg-chelatase subunit ChlD n=1 Tax=Parvularcula dongshanensis TaxID=1173995 RepID=A0A840HZS3_9PROT|nr:hypothetical protein [Parvularcula dongshanensis]MBB4657523.1 Mg-chelatase subunit ChlD [Parvularcula dongshanensis]
MPILVQKRIYRADLRANRHVWYVFGDNEARTGKGGQAREMRDEPNAIGIATKRTPSRADDAYWSDKDYSRNVACLEHDFRSVAAALRRGELVVWPLDGIGTDRADLANRAPRTFEKLQEL